MPLVAFVPFSGLRVRERELLELGMTLPSLRERGEAIAGLPPLGLLTLAGMTPEPWTKSWHDLSSPAPEARAALVEELVRQAPDLVAISALTASIQEAYAFADALRGRGLTVVMGGLHVSMCPEEAAAHADIIAIGDGEPVWPAILRDVEAGRTKPRYQAGVFDLSEAPLPDFDLPGPRTSRYAIQTERGCPLACEFCGASRLLGPFREKPLDRIAAELAAITARTPRPLIELADDNTFAGNRDPAPLLALFREAEARWFTEVDWRVGEDPELVDLLVESGCVQALVGIESLVFRHSGMGAKDRELGRITAACEAMQARGLPVNACLIVGADGEDHDSLNRLEEFLLQSPFAEIQLTLQTPFPGTALRRRLEAEGRLLADRDWSHCTLFDGTFQPDRLSVSELEQGFRGLLSRVFAAGPSRRRRALRREIWSRRRGRGATT